MILHSKVYPIRNILFRFSLFLKKKNRELNFLYDVKKFSLDIVRKVGIRISEFKGLQIDVQQARNVSDLYSLTTWKSFTTLVAF